MLQPILKELNLSRIVLASGSPRRKEILSSAGICLEIIPSVFEENLDKSLFKHPSDYAKENAKQKALEVASRLLSDNRPADLVIGVDTIVVKDSNILEKPKTEAKALEMLNMLHGTIHKVYSGVTFVSVDLSDSSNTSKHFKFQQFVECTEVEFAELSDEVIRSYVKTGEPLDKAGGYGIQGIGGTLVKSIKGDYFNVVGFPLHRFCCELQNWYKNRNLQNTVES